MANEKNLIPNDQRTPSERRENARKAGQASGAARRRKRNMRQAVSTLLSAGLDVREEGFIKKITPRLLALGIEVEDATYQDVLLAGILMKAIRGDVRAAKFIRDTAGESPALEIRKAELKLRKEELKLKREQQTGDKMSNTENNLLSAILNVGEIGTDDLPEVQ